MKKTKEIKFYTQSDQAKGGIEVYHFPTDLATINDRFAHISHRHDYYLIVLIEEGELLIQVDFQELCIQANQLLIIHPFQLHSFISKSIDLKGYAAGITSFLMPISAIQVLEHIFHNSSLSPHHFNGLMNYFKLLHSAYNETTYFQKQLIASLTESLIYKVTDLSIDRHNELEQTTKTYQIVQAFKQLITPLNLHSPLTFFAKHLNVSTTHLNYCVKEVTGKTASSLLRDRVVVEAKRLLYATNLDVKEVAFKLGFDDHAYFSRLFKKETGQTPKNFRLLIYE